MVFLFMCPSSIKCISILIKYTLYSILIYVPIRYKMYNYTKYTLYHNFKFKAYHFHYQLTEKLFKIKNLL